MLGKSYYIHNQVGSCCKKGGILSWADLFPQCVAILNSILVHSVLLICNSPLMQCTSDRACLSLSISDLWFWIIYYICVHVHIWNKGKENEKNNVEWQSHIDRATFLIVFKAHHLYHRYLLWQSLFLSKSNIWDTSNSISNFIINQWKYYILYCKQLKK